VGCSNVGQELPGKPQLAWEPQKTGQNTHRQSRKSTRTHQKGGTQEGSSEGGRGVKLREPVARPLHLRKPEKTTTAGGTFRRTGYSQTDWGTRKQTGPLVVEADKTAQGGLLGSTPMNPKRAVPPNHRRSGDLNEWWEKVGQEAKPIIEAGYACKRVGLAQ